MKKRLLIAAALMLLGFGSAKAQDTVVSVQRKSDTIILITPDMSKLPELMRDLGVTLGHLSDSVDWKTFEQDMEKWGREMEDWGRKMGEWGKGFEGKMSRPQPQQPPRFLGAPVHAIQVEGSGNVVVEQKREEYMVQREDPRNAQYYETNGTLVLSGSSEYEVAMPYLDEVLLRSSGDVTSRGILHGRTLNIFVSGSGDLWMDLDYDTINIRMSGSGDVTLQGQCGVLLAEMTGSGDLNVEQLRVVEHHINATGSGQAWVNKRGNVTNYQQRKEQNAGRRPKKKDLLLDAHWNGFQTGLNLLTDAPGDLDVRPLRCWYFDFNIADVGIAFDRRHIVGLFTGIGIGWNNYSWNNPITLEYDPEDVAYVVEPIEPGPVLKNTKYGVLYLEMPLMFEVRPPRHMYIDAGVTGGLRIAQWNRVKFAEGPQMKYFYGAPINRFKLDASFRMGGDNLGFFANYGLLPLFTMNDTEVHPVCFGFSVNF